MNTTATISKFSIPPFYTMEMMKFAAELESSGVKVAHLEVGQSIARTPQIVVDAAVKALHDTPMNYCSALGLFELRQAIAAHYFTAYGLEIDPNCVVITPGTSLGLYISLLMNFPKGAKIAIAAPSYPCYRNVIAALGFTAVEIPTYAAQNYLITPDHLAEYGEGIAGLLIASPNNPTGSMYDENSLKKLAAYCYDKGIYILSDEIYHGIVYEHAAQTILKFTDRATVINGFSKYFAMTGWRLGWIIISKEDVGRYESLLQNIILCTSPLTQMAAIKAFSASQELDVNVANYKKNRDSLHEALLKAGLTQTFKPQGAFYIYVELPDVNLKSMDVCKKLLLDEHIAVAPGLDFSSSETTCCIRLSFCQHQDVIEHAAGRLTAFIKKL